MQTFGSFHFDPAERTLWCGGSPLPLTRKAAALLSCLIDGRGSWISKSAIMASVWPDTHVHPDNVKVLVREIRVALGDDFHAPRYIQSEPGRGYMFVAELQSEESAAATQPRSEAPLFINRGSELAQLNDAFDSVRASDRRVVVWPEARVAPGADLDDCIVAGAVDVPAGFRARSAVLVPAHLLHAQDRATVRDGIAVFDLV